MIGRVKTFEAIVKGENIPAPGVPESFRVLMKELQSLGLDIKALDENKNVLELRESDDDLPGAQDVNIKDDDEEDTVSLMGGVENGGADEEGIDDSYEMSDDDLSEDDVLDF